MAGKSNAAYLRAWKARNKDKVRESNARQRNREKVTKITREQLDAMLDTDGDTYEPRGLFIVEEYVDGHMVYTAVNNKNGDALTEEFSVGRTATRWLHGYVAHNIYGEELNQQEGDT